MQNYFYEASDLIMLIISFFRKNPLLDNENDLKAILNLCFQLVEEIEQ